MNNPRLRVLLIEDDEDDYILIRDMLSEIFDSPYKLDWVASYDVARETMEQCLHDVYLLDYRLGEHNGLELLKEMIQKGCRAPIIFLTGQEDYKVDLEAMRAGAADYLVKSQISPPLLERSIRYAVETKRAADALKKSHEELEQRVKERTSKLAAANDALKKEVADRKMAEKAVKKSSEKIKLFAYSVSHDLKSPAVGIHGLAKLLHKQYQSVLDERGRNYCDQILRASEQIAALVEQINAYISTKEAPLTIETFQLDEIFQTIREEFSPQINHRRIKWSEPELTPEIKADKMSIVRVLRNLVDNALKYGGDDLSEITLGYEETEDSYILSVKDNGVGLKKEDSKKIFGHFERIQSSRGVEGSGLGLAIVKEIAEQHKGQVWTEPGTQRGITFYISISKCLPLSK